MMVNGMVLVMLMVKLVGFGEKLLMCRWFECMVLILVVLDCIWKKIIFLVVYCDR